MLARVGLFFLFFLPEQLESTAHAAVTDLLLWAS